MYLFTYWLTSCSSQKGFWDTDISLYSLQAEFKNMKSQESITKNPQLMSNFGYRLDLTTIGLMQDTGQTIPMEIWSHNYVAITLPK